MYCKDLSLCKHCSLTSGEHFAGVKLVWTNNFYHKLANINVMAKCFSYTNSDIA